MRVPNHPITRREGLRALLGCLLCANNAPALANYIAPRKKKFNKFDAMDSVSRDILAKTTEIIFRESRLYRRLNALNANRFDGGVSISRPMIYE